MRAEFEERQRSNPMNGILSGAAGQASGGPAPNPMGGFDVASFLAGSGSSGSGSGSGSAAPAGNGGNTQKNQGKRR